MWLRHRVEIYRRLANLRNLSMGNYLRFGMGQFLAQSMIKYIKLVEMGQNFSAKWSHYGEVIALVSYKMGERWLV